jgi:hypothetical protein
MSIDVDYTVCLQVLVQIMSKAAMQANNYVVKNQEIQHAFCQLLNTIQNDKGVGDASRMLEEALNESEHAATTAIDRLVDRLQKSKKKDLLIQKTMEAQGVLTMPHEDVTLDLVEERLKLFHQFLLQAKRDGDVPFLVTVARSADDGFTPMDHVEQLQVRILKHVHSYVCGCQKNNRDDHDWTHPQHNDIHDGEGSCCMELVFDYGQWDGSTLYG